MLSNMKTVIESNIKLAGRHLFGVADSPPFAYSIGNYLVQLPELICVGLGGESASILNVFSEKMIRDGREFSNGELIDIGGRVPCMAIHCMDRSVWSDWTCQAGFFFGHNDYRVTQIVLPDTKGRFGEGADHPYSSYPLFGMRPS